MWSIMVYHDILWSITWYIKWSIMVYITIKLSVIPINDLLWYLMIYYGYITVYIYIMRMGSIAIYYLSWLGHIRTMDMKLLLWLHDHLNQKMQSGQTWIRHVYQQKIAGCREPCTNATRCSEMISPNSFCWFFFTRVIDMNLDPPISAKSRNKSKKRFDLSTERPWVPKSPYKNTLQ